MNSKPLISIIIPVFNTEKYIKRTLESICNQTNKDCEIILVNDGTTDKSINIAKEYLKNQEIKYKIINQENLGQSKARNKGIEESCGEYLLFLDSDDYIESNLIEQCKNELKENIDMLLYDYKRVKDNGEIIENKKQLFNDFHKIISGKEVFYAYKNNEIRIWTASVIYKREYIINNKIKFLENSYAAEDLNFLFKSLLKSEKVKCIDTPLAYYYQRKDSLTNNPDIEKNITVIDSMEDVCEYIKSNNLDNNLIDIIKTEFIPEHIMYQILGAINKNNTSIIRSIIKRPKVKSYLKQAKKESTRYGKSVYMWIKMASTSATVFITVFLKKTGR